MNNQVLHLQKVMTHIELVRQACISLNEKLDEGLYGSISDEEIKNHDASKFSQVEILGYTKQFYTDDKNSLEWKAALMHHYKNNKHHWQYWLDDGGIKGICDGQKTPLDMPSEQILIMVADWLAAGYQYQGSTDIGEWLNDNIISGKVVLSSETKGVLNDVLKEIGFIIGDYGFYAIHDDAFIKSLEYSFIPIISRGVK